MARSLSIFGWRPSVATLAATILIIAGFLLTGISWGFLALVAFGTFGPGILREFGWLKDRDEFQMRAARRAGYHAFLACGLVAMLIVSFLRTQEEMDIQLEGMVTTLLVLLWFTWFLSSLITFRGARKTAVRILIVFGSFWLLFAMASSLDEESTSLLGMLMALLVALPFFFLAWLSRRLPRITGLLLIAASVFFIYFFKLYEIFGDDPLEKARPVVLILFVGPLLASGIALIRKGGDDDAEPEE